MIGNEEHLGYDNTPDLEGDVMDAPICIDDLEKKMLSQEQVECPVFHHFGPGVYMREAMFPAGSIGIGHKHKHDQPPSQRSSFVAVGNTTNRSKWL